MKWIVRENDDLHTIRITGLRYKSRARTLLRSIVEQAQARTKR